MNRDPQLDAQATQLLLADVLDADDELRKQFPPAPPSTPSLDQPADFDTTYTNEPPNMRVIPLMKEKYATQRDADERAVEILGKTGEKLWRRFSTARAFCYQVWNPSEGGPR